MNEIKLHVESAGDFFRRACDLARRVDKGVAAGEEHHLSFESLEGLLRTFMPNRWALLRALKAKGPSSFARSP